MLSDHLAEIGRGFHSRGWVPGTSGNFSAVVSEEPFRLAITASGVDKGSLTNSQILQVDANNRAEQGEGRPSAETLIHLAICRARAAKAVLHTHSVWSNIVSEIYGDDGGLTIEGQEMLKGLQGVDSHEHREWMPILENSQDYQSLSRLVGATLEWHPRSHGFLLRRHGLYTWGASLVEARRHVEILEYLLEVTGRSLSVFGNQRERRRRNMTTVRIPDENRTLTDPVEVHECLAGIGIHYRHWEPSRPVADDAPAEQILSVYSEEIEKLKQQGGYVTADVIDVKSDTPGLDEMLARFNREHWHDEDEVRFVIKGRGLFHIRPERGPVVAVEVEAGDLLRVPRGTWHWFDLCSDREIRCIRLFQDPAGWTPHYTGSGVDRQYEPVCFGPNYISARGF